MSWRDRIVIDPAILVGKPVIKGTRIALEFVLELMAEGWTREQIVRNYPHLTEEDLRAVLHYASDLMKGERVYPLAVWRGSVTGGRESRGGRGPGPPGPPGRGA